MEEVVRPTLGWREWVSLPGLGIPWVKAKIDTGARTSSIHAVRPEVVRRDGVEVVRFRVIPLQRRRRPVVHAEMPLHEWRIVKSSSGHESRRPVVLTDLVLLGETVRIELTLVPRDDMGFRMLVGREAIRGRFVVDPGRSFADRPARKRARKYARTIDVRRKRKP